MAGQRRGWDGWGGPCGAWRRTQSHQTLVRRRHSEGHADAGSGLSSTGGSASRLHGSSIPEAGSSSGAHGDSQLRSAHQPGLQFPESLQAGLERSLPLGPLVTGASPGFVAGSKFTPGLLRSHDV